MHIELTQRLAEAILIAQEDIERFAGQAQRSNVEWTRLWTMAERVLGREIEANPIDQGVNWRLRAKADHGEPGVIWKSGVPSRMEMYKFLKKRSLELQRRAEQ